MNSECHLAGDIRADVGNNYAIKALQTERKFVINPSGQERVSQCYKNVNKEQIYNV